MKESVKRLNQNSHGFTLVELLIVIAIVGILAAVIYPKVTDLSGSGQTEAAQAEAVTVQSAMDTMMAKSGLTTLPSSSTAGNNMASFPDTTHPLYPNYIRSANTIGTYTCDANGKVTQVSSGNFSSPGNGGGATQTPGSGGTGHSPTDFYVSDSSTLVAGPLMNAPSLPITTGSYTWTNAQIISSPSPYWSIISGVNWISTTSANSGVENANEGDAWRIFKTSFNVAADAIVTNATVNISADNAFEFYLNGTKIATSTDFSPSAPVYGASSADGTTAPFTAARTYTIAPVTGSNTLVFVVRNWNNNGNSNPSGLTYKVSVTH